MIRLRLDLDGDVKASETDGILRRKSPILDALFIDPAPVAAAQVHDTNPVVGSLETRVTPRQLLIRKEEIALRVPTDDERVVTDLVLRHTIAVSNDQSTHGQKYGSFGPVDASRSQISFGDVLWRSRSLLPHAPKLFPRRGAWVRSTHH